MHLPSLVRLRNSKPFGMSESAKNSPLSQLPLQRALLADDLELKTASSLSCMRLPEAADHRVRPVRAARAGGSSQEERTKHRHAAAGCRPCGACCLLAHFEHCLAHADGQYR